MKRPTIADIARRAGVTKAAVSFALNGHPGVSASTRERILAIADEIGFEPGKAARALAEDQDAEIAIQRIGVEVPAGTARRPGDHRLTGGDEKPAGPS